MAKRQPKLNYTSRGRCYHQYPSINKYAVYVMDDFGDSYRVLQLGPRWHSMSDPRAVLGPNKRPAA